jgi:hypothetical protein
VGGLAVLSNVRAGRTRVQLDRVRKQLAGCHADVYEVDDLPSIVDATQRALAKRPALLAINGGDGTTQAALTEIRHQAGPPPQIAVLPGGTTNLTAHDLNGRLGLDAALASLIRVSRLPAAGHTVLRRPLIALHLPDQPTQFGFFLGAGAILAGMRHFKEHVGSRGLRDELAAGVSLLRGLAGVASGEHAWSNHETSVTAEGCEQFAGPQNLVLATTLERLLLGLRPWWSSGPGAIHLTAVGHRPSGLLRVVPSILRGKPHDLATPERGYRSANVDSFVLDAREGVALDGEVFTPAGGSTMRVSATLPMSFVKLGR